MGDDIKNFKQELDIKDKVLLDEIPWEDKYCIGLKEMDNEHMMILEKINLLIRGMNKNHLGDMKKAYNELYQVTHTHFSHEEDHLQDINYPAFDSHKKIHENLLEKLLSFGSKIENNDLDKPMLASFLRNWLFTHIMGIDVKYAAYEAEQFRPAMKLVS
jgi:hemerythrin-like metal-binding protein